MADTDRYVLFVGGGKWQEPWFSFLKKKGHKIIVVDPYDWSPCIKNADVFIKCDVKDTNEILEVISKNNYHIEFVTSDQTDVSTLPVAELSEKLNLKANDPRTVELFSNKFKNRKFLKENFTSHFPHFIQAYSAGDIINFYKDQGGPIIIKPVDAQSSRGIYKVDKTNLGDAEILFENCISFSSADYIIAEVFIIGKEITVEGICIENKHHTLATSDKKHFRTGIASELRYPSRLNETLLKKIVEFHNSFVEKTGLQFGITHSEYLVNDEQTDFWLIEAACRGGGSLIPSHIVPWVSEVDIYSIFYQILTNQTVTIKPTNTNKPAILYFFEFENGFVKRIEGIDELRKIEGVLCIDLEFEEGSVLKAATDDRSRQGFTIIFAKTIPELESKLQTVIKELKISIDSKVQ